MGFRPSQDLGNFGCGYSDRFHDADDLVDSNFSKTKRLIDTFGNLIIGMILTITAFGIARDILGAMKYELEVSEGITSGELLSKLSDQFEDFSKLNSLLLAVNEEYANDDLVLQEGDDVVLIPPVSGG